MLLPPCLTISGVLRLKGSLWIFQTFLTSFDHKPFFFAPTAFDLSTKMFQQENKHQTGFAVDEIGKHKVSVKLWPEPNCKFMDNA